jgi:hypothetical protein
VQDAHLPERQAERIRRNLRHHRFEALSDRSRADIDRHRPIRLEKHIALAVTSLAGPGAS